MSNNYNLVISFLYYIQCISTEYFNEHDTQITVEIDLSSKRNDFPQSTSSHIIFATLYQSLHFGDHDRTI